MTQNTSSAVMQQRASKKDAIDDFPTPPWATRALIEHAIMPLLNGGREAGLGQWHNPLREQSVWEPACGRGFMSEVLKERFGEVLSSDVVDYGYADTDERALGLSFPDGVWKADVDWVVTNPPFNQAARFIETALVVAKRGVAMLVRTAFLEGVGRYNFLFRKRPPTLIAFFSERVPMVKGRCDAKASTATAYCWLIWTNAPPQPPVWIPPCRKTLERHDDYIEPRLRTKRSAP